MDNIIEQAHVEHKARYGKKCNFDKHWTELQRQPKWRTPTTNSGSTNPVYTPKKNGESYKKCNFDKHWSERLVKDYFAENLVYTPETFRRRFRIGRHVFLRIVHALSNFDPYF